MACDPHMACFNAFSQKLTSPERTLKKGKWDVCELCYNVINQPHQIHFQDGPVITMIRQVCHWCANLMSVCCSHDIFQTEDCSLRHPLLCSQCYLYPNWIFNGISVGASIMKNSLLIIITLGFSHPYNSAFTRGQLHLAILIFIYCLLK